MGSTQNLLILVGLALFTLLALNQGKRSQDQTSNVFNNEAIVIATSIGQSIFEKMEQRSFDENTISNEIETADSLTSPYLLGPESGETNLLDFDDIDDFNNYTSLDTNNRFDEFTSEIRIVYVDKDNPQLEQISRSFLKKAEVKVTNNYLLDTVKLSYLFGY